MQLALLISIRRRIQSVSAGARDCIGCVPCSPLHRQNRIEFQPMIFLNFQNMTITRFLHQRVCYIRPKSPEEPTLDDLKKSMDLVRRFPLTKT